MSDSRERGGDRPEDDLREAIESGGIDAGTVLEILREFGAAGPGDEASYQDLEATVPLEDSKRPVTSDFASMGTGTIRSLLEVGELGKGGMGRVIEALDLDLRRRVAVKSLLPRAKSVPEAQQKFLAEAQITGQLEHPNIVPVHEMGRTEDGGIYFSMKKVEGESLADRLAGSRDQVAETGGCHRGEALLRDFLKICEAIRFAHSKGVMRRRPFFRPRRGLSIGSWP